MTPEYGAASQLEKINMLDYADVIAINKFDKAGALMHWQMRKQYKRNHGLWSTKDEELPVIEPSRLNSMMPVLMSCLKD